MTQQKKANGYWKDNKERCAQEAIKYKKRIEFQKKSPAAYGAAWKGGFLDEICTHMSYFEYDPVIWTKDYCYEIVNGYMTRGELKNDNPSAYKAAREHGWLDEFFENKPFHGYKNKKLERRYYKGGKESNNKDA